MNSIAPAPPPRGRSTSAASSGCISPRRPSTTISSQPSPSATEKPRSASRSTRSSSTPPERSTASVYFKALDDAAFFAANSVVEDVFVLTTNFNIQLLRTVTEGTLIATGSPRQRNQEPAHRRCRAQRRPRPPRRTRNRELHEKPDQARGHSGIRRLVNSEFSILNFEFHRTRLASQRQNPAM